MSVADAIRSWKDEDFLMTLNEEHAGLLPENPAGNVGLDHPNGKRDDEVCVFTRPPVCESTNIIFCTRKPIC